MRIERKENSLERNALWNTVGNFAYLFSQWLLSVVIVRITSYQDAGIYSLAVSVTNVLVCISFYGIRNFQVSDLRNQYSDKEYRVNRCLTCFLSLVLCIVILLVTPYSMEQKCVILLYMLFRIEEAYADVLQGMAQKRSRLDIVGISFLMKGIVNTVTFVAALSFTKNLPVSIIAMILSTAVIMAGYDRVKIRHLPDMDTDCAGRKVLELLREGLPLVLYTTLVAATPAIPRYVLEIVHGQEMLGIYATIATPAVIIQAAAGYLLAPLIVPLSEKYHKNDKRGFNSLLGKLLFAMAGIFLLCMAGAKVFGRLGLRLLFGAEILEYSYLLMPVLACTVVTAMAWIINAVLVIFRQLKAVFFINAMGTGISCIISGYLIKGYGLNGTSYSHMLSIGIQSVIGMLVLGKLIRKGFHDKEKGWEENAENRE